MEFELHLGDCAEVLKTLPDNSVDSIVTDPPYGLSKEPNMEEVMRHWMNGDDYKHKGSGFMGKTWDSFVPGPAIWKECLRVLKPGGHLLAFFGSRTYDMGTLAIRLAGFEIRDQIMWLYGCLSEDTEVLINGEWVQYHKAKVGDLALCYNKENDTYGWQPIEDTHKYEYCDTAYRIHSNNTDQIVSRNHRVLVERGGAYKFEYAENLARERQIRVPILESLPTLLDDLSVREPLPSGEETILQRKLRNVRPPTGSGETDRATRNDGDCVCRVRDEGTQAERLVEESENPNMLTQVQREVARGGMEGARTQGESRVVGGNESAVRGEPARGEQPGLEGWGHSKEGTRELQGCPVCAVPGRVSSHVAEGWVRDGASSSGGTRNRKATSTDGGCASCESRSGGQSAGEPVPVCVESGSQAVRGARYTTSDLADIEPVHYEGVVWCLTVPTGAFVVRRNGKVFVTGNSGFPKSHDVSKAIDKAAPRLEMFTPFAKHYAQQRAAKGMTHAAICEAGKFYDNHNHGGASVNWEKGHNVPTLAQWKVLQPLLDLSLEWLPLIQRIEAEREIVEQKRTGDPFAWYAESQSGDGVFDITAPATEAARQWQGWGTALKPAHEPVCVARKPLVGTVAANVLEYGTGAINIDGCRVGTSGDRNNGRMVDSDIYGKFGPIGRIDYGKGRWPANVIHDGLDEEWARYFYCAKASKKDRDEGLEHMEAKPGGSMEANVGKVMGLGGASLAGEHKERQHTKNTHPTVKPTDLMRYLCRLVTPPSGIVLDPFMGSGSTGKAAMLEDFRFIGIDLTPEYVEIARARIQSAIKQKAFATEDCQLGLF